MNAPPDGPFEHPVPASGDGPSPSGEVANESAEGTVGSLGAAAASTLTFEQAIAQGVAAAKDAVRARTEIQVVLDELARAIGTTLHISPMPAMSIVRRDVSVVAERGDENGPIFSSVESLRLGTSNGKHVFLCTFTPTSHGYPVDIEYADVLASCHDKDSLTGTLKEMLAHPDVARKLLDFANPRRPPGRSKSH